MKRLIPLLLCAAACAAGLAAQQQPGGKLRRKENPPRGAQHRAKPAGAPMIWRDRGALTPSRVYFGEAADDRDPLARLPSPPFGKFEALAPEGRGHSPKCRLTDSKGVKWTVKFGPEAHADAAAPRLAWALGFGAVEGYFIDAGSIDGVGPATNLGQVKDWVSPEGKFTAARFKRHDKQFESLKDTTGNDLFWEELVNPGVPPEQFDGLRMLDVMLQNWDAQKKNCKVYRFKGPQGPEDWYIVSDMGASFADGPKNKYVLADYENSADWVRSVSNGWVELRYRNPIRSEARAHSRFPLAHAQWFRKQLEKLTNDDIQAAFDAAYATEGLNQAYASGDTAAITTARQKDLSTADRAEVAGYVAAVRARIRQFEQMVPAG